MGQEITVKEAKPLGEPDPKFGQTYWLTVKEFNTPVKLSTKKQLRAGDTLYGSLTEAMSQKGTSYMKFRREDRPEHNYDTPASTPQTSPKAAGRTEYDSEGAAWGNALTNATALVVAAGVKSLDTIADDVYELTVKLYQTRERYKKQTVENLDASSGGDTVLEDIEDSISLDDIPF